MDQIYPIGQFDDKERPQGGIQLHLNVTPAYAITQPPPPSFQPSAPAQRQPAWVELWWSSLPRASQLFLACSLAYSVTACSLAGLQLGQAEPEFLQDVLLILCSALFFLFAALHAHAAENAQALLLCAGLAALNSSQLIVFGATLGGGHSTAIGLVVASIALLGGCAALVPSVHSSFGWRAYGKLLLLLFLAAVANGANPSGPATLGVLIGAAAAGLPLMAAWLSVAQHAAGQQQHARWALAAEFSAPVGYVMPLLVIFEGLSKRGLLGQAHGLAYLITYSLLFICSHTAVCWDLRLLSRDQSRSLSKAGAKAGGAAQGTAAEGGNVGTAQGPAIGGAVAVPDLPQDILPLAHGAWLRKLPSGGQPSSGPVTPGAGRWRFFRLSHDGSTLRWSWKKFVLLWQVEDLHCCEDDLTITLRLMLDPDLRLLFPDRPLFEAWQRGLMLLLRLLNDPLGLQGRGPAGAAPRDLVPHLQAREGGGQNSSTQSYSPGRGLLKRMRSSRRACMEDLSMDYVRQASLHARHALRGSMRSGIQLRADGSGSDVSSSRGGSSSSGGGGGGSRGSGGRRATLSEPAELGLRSNSWGTPCSPPGKAKKAAALAWLRWLPSSLFRSSHSSDSSSSSPSKQRLTAPSPGRRSEDASLEREACARLAKEGPKPMHRRCRSLSMDLEAAHAAGQVAGQPTSHHPAMHPGLLLPVRSGQCGSGSSGDGGGSSATHSRQSSIVHSRQGSMGVHSSHSSAGAASLLGFPPSPSLDPCGLPPLQQHPAGDSSLLTRLGREPEGQTPAQGLSGSESLPAPVHRRAVTIELSGIPLAPNSEEPMQLGIRSHHNPNYQQQFESQGGQPGVQELSFGFGSLQRIRESQTQETEPHGPPPCSAGPAGPCQREQQLAAEGQAEPRPVLGAGAAPAAPGCLVQGGLGWASREEGGSRRGSQESSRQPSPREPCPGGAPPSGMPQPLGRGPPLRGWSLNVHRGPGELLTAGSGMSGLLWRGDSGASLGGFSSWGLPTPTSASARTLSRFNSLLPTTSSLQDFSQVAGAPTAAAWVPSLPLGNPFNRHQGSNKSSTDGSTPSPDHTPLSVLRGLSINVPVPWIEYEELVFGRLLGEGSEGSVHAAWYQETPVAVKRTQSLQEVEMCLHAGSHDNIVGLRGLCQHGSHIYLVMELCARGTLDVLIHQASSHRLEPLKLLPIVRSVARGMLHLHSRKPPILHRDLKPANLFIAAGGVIKVGDFGMSRYASGGRGGRGGALERTLTPGVIGTAAYSAPEVLGPESPSSAAASEDTERLLKADVFSFGVTLWEIIERKRPFAGMDGFQVQTQWFLEPETMRLPPIAVPEGLTPQGRQIILALAGLVQSCTQWDPSRRPSFKEILAVLRTATGGGESAPPTPSATAAGTTCS